MALTVKFQLLKKTPGTFRYQEVPDDEHQDRGVIGGLYILKKDAEKLGNPENITVTIEAS